MQDFKHFTKKKSFRLLRRKSSPQNLRRLLPESKRAKKRWRTILPALAIILALLPIIGLLVSSRQATVPAATQRHATAAPLSFLDSYQSFKLALDSLGSSHYADGKLSAPLADGGMITYSLDNDIQDRVKKVMEQKRVPYGAVIAIEPKTGKILALAGYSSREAGWEQRCFFSPFPMASLFKIVTAAAALEEKKVSPQTVVAFRGKLTSENPRYWSVLPRKPQQMELSLALGKSVNPVFGRLASDVVGRDSLMTFVDRFGFNQNLMPGTPIIPSPAKPPGSTAELQLMGAGLAHEVKISPLHAAMMMAAIANDGVMLVPTLAKEIRNGKGEVISAGEARVLRRMVTPQTAGNLALMLSTTVRSGTSRKVFHDRRGRPLLSKISVAAKTGSINGRDPAGHYSWFTAYAPIDDPQIALAAMVINDDKWKIKATYLGEQALEAFFK